MSNKTVKNLPKAYRFVANLTLMAVLSSNVLAFYPRAALAQSDLNQEKIEMKDLSSNYPSRVIEDIPADQGAGTSAGESSHESIDMSQMGPSANDDGQDNPPAASRPSSDLEGRKEARKRGCAKFWAIAGCILAAAGATTGCVFASKEANRLFTQVHEAEGIAGSDSLALRNTCRNSSYWAPNCANALDKLNCPTSDKVLVNSPLEELNWKVGTCGDWTGFEHDFYQMVPVCSTNCYGTVGQPGYYCVTSCHNVRQLVKTVDLSAELKQCPDYSDYQAFLNSDDYKTCQAASTTLNGQAAGYTVGAVLAALAAAGGVAGAVVAGCAMP